MAGNNNTDPTYVLVMFLAVIGGTCWGVWYAFSKEFMEAVRYLRMAEITVLVPFSDQATACFYWLKDAKVGGALPTQATVGAAVGCFGRDFISSLPASERMNYYSVSPDSLGFVSRYIGSYMRWILIAMCGYIVYYALYKTDRKKFRTTFNLESFIKIQAKVWPVISPIVNFNPAKSSSRIVGDVVPSNLPLFAEALAPEEWISYHQIPMANDIPERQATYNAFALQLGPRWTSVAKLPIYMQALIAAFALKGTQKREESDDFLGEIALCWSDKGGFKPTPELVKKIKSTLKDPKVGGEALKIAQKHAYRTTAIIGTLKWARFMGGVLASAQFLWLRGVDRHLWYALNNLGRRSFHSEGAGSMAHYMAEEIAKKALVVPRLETAITTINKYTSEKQISIPPFSDGTKVIARD